MKRLIITAAAAMALLTTTAQAKTNTFTLFKGPSWETTGTARNAEGNPMCTMQSHGTTNAIWIKWTAQVGLVVQVFDIGWRMTEGTKVPFKVEFFDNERPGQNAWISTEAGDVSNKGGMGASVFMYVGNDDVENMLQAFADADLMTISFPQGDEPPWRAKMDGTRKAVAAFKDCAQLVAGAKQPKATEPVGPQATQPVTSKATQPVAEVQPTQPMLFKIPADVSAGHMNVRSGPGANHGLIGAIPAGQTVSASRCAKRDDGVVGADWCLVTWSGLTGWVSQVGLMPVPQGPMQTVEKSAMSKDDGGI